MNKKVVALLAIVFFALGIYGVLFRIIPLKEEVHDQTKVEECYMQISGNGKSIGLADPSASFCGCMGGKYFTEKDAKGQGGICQFGSKTYESWEYFDLMNPYESAYSQPLKGDEERKRFCEENRTSIYCKNYKGFE